MAITRTVTFEDAERQEWREDNEDGPVRYGIEWKAGSRPANFALLVDKLEQAIPVFRQNFTDWPTMTNVQKDAATRQAQRAIANLLRYVRGIDSAGNGA